MTGEITIEFIGPLGVRYIRPEYAGRILEDGTWDDHWARMSLRGEWSRAQVNAIQRRLRDWLQDEGLELCVLDITSFGMPSPRFLLRAVPSALRYEWTQSESRMGRR